MLFMIRYSRYSCYLTGYYYDNRYQDGMEFISYCPKNLHVQFSTETIENKSLIKGRNTKKHEASILMWVDIV